MRTILILSLLVFSLSVTEAEGADILPTARPNILWITSEDHGIEMGCYGDDFATTPNVDQLAARGLTYRFAWSNAPVCAPARTTIITGMYPTSTGSEHMRSSVPFPSGLAMYPQLLHAAGYYCTNNSKEDYNLTRPGKVWDESSVSAHWNKRPDHQPFFAIFNSTVSHEHAIWTRPHELEHDPDQVRVPAYHPDTPEVRHDWAQYYDTVTAADRIAGERLAELAAAGLAEDTIVFYYGDHGAGMPRSKRWPGNSGLRVPLIVYIPEKFRDLRPSDYQPGAQSDRLVSFVDLAPSLLSLAGVNPPDWMQGKAFLGPFATPEPSYLHGFRGRMDERIDLVRSVTDGRYVYLRNYRPDLPAGQFIAYQARTDTTRVWRLLHERHLLTPEQDAFWLPHPPEELFDLHNDPDEVHNLAADPNFSAIKARLRAAQQAHSREILDVGFLPEAELHTRAPGVSPYDFARSPGIYPFDRIFETAEIASLLEPAVIPDLVERCDDPDSAVRYWAVLGLAMRGADGVAAGLLPLRTALVDESVQVRIVAAGAVAQHGPESDHAAALELLVAAADPAQPDSFASLAALNVLDHLGPLPSPVRGWIEVYATQADSLPESRYRSYLLNLLAHLRATGADPING